jgi:hypothetical protein
MDLAVFSTEEPPCDPRVRVRHAGLPPSWVTAALSTAVQGYPALNLDARPGGLSELARVIPDARIHSCVICIFVSVVFRFAM